MGFAKEETTVGQIMSHPFCERMKEARLEKGMSFRTLAEKIGTGSRSYLSHIEQGRYSVSMEIGLAICQILDVPMHLCLDFIATKEVEKLQTQMQKEYEKWLEYVPGNVLKDMLEDTDSREIHARLTGDLVLH